MHGEDYILGTPTRGIFLLYKSLTQKKKKIKLSNLGLKIFLFRKNISDMKCINIFSRLVLFQFGIIQLSTFSIYYH